MDARGALLEQQAGAVEVEEEEAGRVEPGGRCGAEQVACRTRRPGRDPARAKPPGPVSWPHAPAPRRRGPGPPGQWLPSQPTTRLASLVARWARAGASRLPERIRSTQKTTPASPVTRTLPTTTRSSPPGSPSRASRAPLPAAVVRVGHDVPAPEERRGDEDRPRRREQPQQEGEQHAPEGELLEDHRAERGVDERLVEQRPQMGDRGPRGSGHVGLGPDVTSVSASTSRATSVWSV